MRVKESAMTDLPKRLYMDNAATSFPKPKQVTAAMVRYANELGASAGRGVYREAIETGELIFECRRQLCELFHGEKPEHFIFTLNCSDALNLAIKGLIGSKPGGHAICTAIDHNSILRPLNALVGRAWLEQTRVPIDPVTGLVDPDDIRKAIRPDTRFIAVTHASNVSGTIAPIHEIGLIAHEHGTPFIVDAAQSAGHLPIDVQADYIDLLAAPGHKGLLGPLGTGFLYIRPGMENLLSTTREGGTGSVSEQDSQPNFMPDKFEAGSHNAIGIIGLLEGLRWIGGQTIAKLAGHERELCGIFLEGMREIEGLALFGPRTLEHRVGVFSVRVGEMQPHALAAVLESRYGILTRPGLHCAPTAHKSFGTLQIGGTTRFSFGPFLTAENVRYAVEALREISRAGTTSQSALGALPAER